MLAIRLKRTGRKSHAQYRVIVQDSRFSPKSGRVVSYIGSYDPHTKVSSVDAESASKYLANGAQPSDRVATILKEAGVKLPKWYSASPSSKKPTKNPEKLRKNQPVSEKPEPTVEKIETEKNDDIETTIEEQSVDPLKTTEEVATETLADDIDDSNTQPDSSEVVTEDPEPKV